MRLLDKLWPPKAPPKYPPVGHSPWVWCDEPSCWLCRSQEPKTEPRPSLPEEDAKRGLYPMAEGLLDYFPNALAEVSRISYEGNLKHNPGEPMHWARGKSTDHRNKVIRHTVDATMPGEPGIEHAAQAAWRSLAFLQEKIEQERGAPLPRNAWPIGEMK